MRGPVIGGLDQDPNACSRFLRASAKSGFNDTLVRLCAVLEVLIAGLGC